MQLYSAESEFPSQPLPSPCSAHALPSPSFVPEQLAADESTAGASVQPAGHESDGESTVPGV